MGLPQSKVRADNFVTLPKADLDPGVESRTFDRRNWMLSVLFDMCLLLPLLGFLAFYNLDTPSISYRDETTHIRAIQEMRASGHWWNPTVNGVSYFNKPPFKMWLTYIPLAFFGESAFSYRFLDALSGVLNCLLVYFFARAVFRSRFAGFCSAIALISCEAYIFGHGIRKAVQDAMLIFLATAACMLAWKLISSLAPNPKDNQKGAFGIAILGGICVGLGALTKNVAGFIPLMIAASYLLLSGDWRLFWNRNARLLGLVILPALLLPAAYLLPHCFSNRSACSIMIGQEVIERSTEGFHNKDNIWFYLIRLFPDRQAVPPELLVLGLGWAAWCVARSRSKLHLFLLTWCLFPVLLFSAIPSRLTWYISPAFPAMALIIGGMTAAAYRAASPVLRAWWQRRSNFTPVAGLQACLVVLALGLLGANYAKVSSLLLHQKPRHEFDQTVEDLLKYSAKAGGKPSIVRYHAPEWSLPETTYGGMIRPLLTEAESIEQVLTLIDKGHTFVVCDLQNFPELAAARPVAGYRYFAPDYERPHWMVMFTYTESAVVPSFTPAKRLFNFGFHGPKTLSGFGTRRGMGGDVDVQELLAPRAAFVIPGDSALKTFSSEAKINLSVLQEIPGAVWELKINDQLIAQSPLTKSSLKSQVFEIPAGAWNNRSNVFAITFKNADGTPVETDQAIALLNWVSIKMLGIR